MRILWFNHRDIRHPQAGGAERTIYEVGRRLAAGGHDVHLATVNTGDLLREEIIEGITIHRANGNIRAHFVVPRLIKRLKPDIIVDDMAHVIPWCSTFFTDAKVIVFFRHLHARTLSGQAPQPLARILAWLENLYPLIYHHSIFITETFTGIEDLLNLGVRNESIIKIPPGVDVELFHRGIKTEKPSLVYFGGMKQYKRPWLAVETLRMLSDIEGVTLAVVGDGNELSKIKEMAAAYCLTDRISFFGHLRRDELAEVVSTSWVNLHFSVAEGFGYSILEAAAAGIPTIAINAPGVTEVVNTFGLGIVVKNINDILPALRKIVGNYEYWSSAVKTSAASFSWERCAEMWQELIIDAGKRT